MGRYDLGKSHGHRCKYLVNECWEISWFVYRYYARSLLRHPRRFSKVVGEKSARRFCEKHNIEFQLCLTLRGGLRQHEEGIDV